MLCWKQVFLRSLEKHGFFSVKSMTQNSCGNCEGISRLFVNMIEQAKIRVKVFVWIFALSTHDRIQDRFPNWALSRGWCVKSQHLLFHAHLLSCAGVLTSIFSSFHGLSPIRHRWFASALTCDIFCWPSYLVVHHYGGSSLEDFGWGMGRFSKGKTRL